MGCFSAWGSVKLNRALLIIHEGTMHLKLRRWVQSEHEREEDAASGLTSDK